MFNTWWLVSTIALLAAMAYAGWKAKGTLLGLLIDGRGRYSLNHIQVAMWTLLVLATWLAALLASSFDPGRLSIPTTLLGLMGISLGSAAASGAIKSAKDGSGAKVARAGASLGTRAIVARPSQVYLEEEGGQADQSVSVTKFQNFVFTIVAGITYASLAYKAQGFPELPEQLVWLIGISHAGYLGGKMPDKQ
jgi:hypothetical protein